MIVKEVRRPGTKVVGVVAAMRNKAGVRANDGWQNDRVEPPGRGQPVHRPRPRGRLCCFSRHVQAKTRDYVFTRRR
ncbi:MAG: hypothetical protein ICV67_04765 [Thermoleophilia bacterium]|nr:hypothetical protein [Thermoleophilia bacterium]